MTFTKISLPSLAAVLLGLGACAGAPTLGTASPLQAADSNGAGGSTSDPVVTPTCKESTDSSGVPCKICVDSSGAISYDDCNGGASGAGGSGGSGGSVATGGTGAGEVKCVPTTDATTGAACKTCYAADGSFTSYCSPPPQSCVDASGKSSCGTGGSGGSPGSGGSGGSGATTVKCLPTTDPSTGAACKTCYAADGSITSNDCSAGGGSGGSGGSGGTTVKCAATTDPSTGATCKTCYDANGSITSNDCSGGTDLKCVPSTDPTTGAACQTCYAPDGSIASNTCSPANSGGASCVGATNIETGQVCKICSDTTTGQLLFVDCPNVCPSTSGTGTTAPRHAK